MNADVSGSQAFLAMQATLTRRLEFERAIVGISAALMRAGAPDLDACIEHALGTIGRFFDVDRAYVFRIPPHGASMSNTHEWVAQNISREAQNLQEIPVETFPWLMRILRADCNVIVPRVADLPPDAATEKAEFVREGIRSIIIVPMRISKALCGFVGFDAVRSEIDWTEDFALGLRLMAQMFASALEARELSARLTELAFHDPLTGLPNRKLLEDRLQRALARNRRRGGSLTLMLVDLDDFKLINDSMGHAAGDRLLCEVSDRLQAVIRDCDTVARLGGDEFVLLLEDADREHAEAVAQRMLVALACPLEIDGEWVVVHSSIGIALADGSAMDGGELLRAADIAMYAAKAEGKNRHAVFDARMEHERGSDPGLRYQLGRALAEDQFRVFLQPRVALDDRPRLVGAEALIRWQHPQRGLLPPSVFLSFAERSSLICDIDLWMLQRAAAWAARSTDPWRLSVNLSPRSLREPKQLERLLQALGAAALPGTRLELELTERVLMEDPQRAIAHLEALKAAAPGLTIAIDDFGTGYSSLNYLRRLPVDVLKIDRSFVADLSHEARNAAAIIRSIVELGHNLGMAVVAEGVETAEQACRLREIGCEEAQGYLFSPPLPAEEFLRRP